MVTSHLQLSDKSKSSLYVRVIIFIFDDLMDHKQIFIYFWP